VYLLDDPFSSLDPQVSDKVFKGAIESLLKESKVVVLVLNDAYLSRYADRADKIFLVKQGEVITDP
jgi:ABC-type hemin transport system ATPase subunit